MSEVSKLAAVANGLVENVNTSTSDLDVLSLWVGGTSGGGATQLTKTILNSLISSAASAMTSVTGDVTGTGPGATAVTISNGVVTLAKMANLAANSIIGNNTVSSATPIALTETQVTAMLNVFSSSLQGLVPASGGGTTNFLRADGTFAAPSGSGANTALSNLITTSINQALIPNADATFNLGSSSLQWNELWTHSVVNSAGPLLLSGAGTIDLNANQIIDIGSMIPAASLTYDLGSLSELWNNLFVATINSAGSNLRIQSEDLSSGSGNTPSIQVASGTTAGSATGSTGNVVFGSGVNANSSSPGNTGDVTLGSGNTNGSGNSGNTLITVGTVSGGTRGLVQIKDGSEGTSGYVWTSTDTLGSGHWMANSGGSAITALTGDATATGPGSVPLTLATVNGDVGSFGSSTAIPTITVNAKGLVTAVSTNVVIAPAGTLTGTVLASNVVTSSLTALGAQSQALDMNSNQINNLAAPTNPNDAVTKSYVDNFINATSWKTAVLCATTANITLSGEQTIDGELTSSSRVLVKDQTAPADNGIYVSAAGAWSRASDMNSWAQVPAAAVFVEEGAVNADLGWVCTSQPGGTLGTDPINFVQFSSAGAYMADGVTLQLVSGVFSIKNGGVGPTQLGVVTDGITTDQSGAGSTIEVKAAGISATQLATGAADQLTIVGGAGTPLSVAQAPGVVLQQVAGQAFVANTSYLVRMGINNNSETTNQIYAADSSAAIANGNFWAIGIAQSLAGVVAGQAIPTMLQGLYTLGSADTPFATSDIGLPVWLTTAGGFSTTAPSASGTAAYKIGIVADVNLILIDSKQLTGVN